MKEDLGCHRHLGSLFRLISRCVWDVGGHRTLWVECED